MLQHFAASAYCCGNVVCLYYSDILLLIIRAVLDLLFPNPAAAVFCRILMANPAGAGAGFFTVDTT